MTEVELGEIIVRVVAALIPAALIGLDRELSAQPAGLRTHLLLALGACLFTLAGTQVAGTDPTRVAAQVVSGVGFLGAGAILRDIGRIKGVTTAASLWVTAAIGVAAGLGAYEALATVSVAAILVLVVLKWVERDILPVRRGQDLAVTLAPHESLVTGLARVREVVPSFVVTQVVDTGEGGHRLLGQSRLPHASDIVAVAGQLQGLDGVVGVQFTR